MSVPRHNGITCTACAGQRLFVERTARPCIGRIVRYKKCPKCGYRTVTVETRRAAKGV